MKVAFHDNQLCVRGTSVAIYAYAHFNEVMLGNESIILYDRTSHWNRPLGKQHFESRFSKIYGYNDWKEVDEILKSENIDVLYMIKGGPFDGKVTQQCKSVIHYTAPIYEPHGEDVYAFVSEWTLRAATNKKLPVIPRIISLPSPSKNIRKSLNIPEDAIVFGRHGGSVDFDISLTGSAIYNTALNNKNIYFLFLNTHKVCDPLPNIIYLDATCDLQEKSNYINSCDAMLHAKPAGESFGQSVAESLFCGKPVISYPHGKGRAYIDMLQDKGIWYNNGSELQEILLNFNPSNYNPQDFKNLVAEFSPEKVMAKFKEVFLS